MHRIDTSKEDNVAEKPIVQLVLKFLCTAHPFGFQGSAYVLNRLFRAGRKQSLWIFDFHVLISQFSPP
jgi:hypothetical protein